MLIYHAGLSYRKTSRIIGELASFSYEALRKWYIKCKDVFQPKKKIRRIVAVDETKIKQEEKQLYLWNAIDINDHIILATHLFTSRTLFDAIYSPKWFLSIVKINLLFWLIEDLGIVRLFED